MIKQAKEIGSKSECEHVIPVGVSKYKRKLVDNLVETIGGYDKQYIVF